jgi:hypothetical protein
MVVLGDPWVHCRRGVNLSADVASERSLVGWCNRKDTRYRQGFTVASNDEVGRRGVALTNSRRTRGSNG